MGYFEHLKSLLYPLRIYELNEGIGAAELFAEGEALDRAQAELESAEREAIPSTAEGHGLAAYEKIMPFVPLYMTAEQRREAIMALLRIDWASFTLEDMNATVAGCGVAAEIGESETPETVTVTILGVRGIPENFDEISYRIEQILPCHLGIEYIFTFLIWRELEEWIADWAELEAAAPTWAALEAYAQ